MQDDFQDKCKLNKITLPLELNKSKLLKKILAAKPVVDNTEPVRKISSEEEP